MPQNGDSLNQEFCFHKAFGINVFLEMLLLYSFKNELNLYIHLF